MIRPLRGSPRPKSTLTDFKKCTAMPHQSSDQSRFKRWGRRWLAAWVEAFKCLGLGARDALYPQLMFRSAALCLAATMLWLWVFVRYFDEMSTVFGVFARVASMGLFLVGYQGFYPINVQASPGVTGVISGIVSSAFQIAQILIVVAVVAVCLYVLMYLFAVATTVRVAMPGFLLTRARRVVLRKYAIAVEAPAPSALRPIWRRLGKRALRTGLILLICLVIPIVSCYVMVLGLCYFNVRLLYGAVARNAPSPQEQSRYLVERWRPLLLLGIGLMLLLLVPVVNLLVPAMMCTCIVHLVHRDNIPALSLMADAALPRDAHGVAERA